MDVVTSHAGTATSPGKVYYIEGFGARAPLGRHRPAILDRARAGTPTILAPKPIKPASINNNYPVQPLRPTELRFVFRSKLYLI